MGGKGSGGKNKKPTAQKKAEGNRGKRKMNPNEPAPAPGEPKMPPFLTAEMKVVWRSLIPILEENGVLSQVDGIALGAMCSSYVLFSKADAAIAKYGSVSVELDDLTGVAVMRVNAAVRVRSDALRSLRASWQAFGLDPSSRAGLSVPAKPGSGKKSALDEILRAKGEHDDIVM